MIELNLYAIPKGENNPRVGKCLARNRFERESMGVGINEMLLGFLKDNMDRFESGVGNSSIVSIINENKFLSRQDLSCINYYLIQSGFMFTVCNVTSDEINSTGVPSGEVIEFCARDMNFIQDDYPTETKFTKGVNDDIISVLKQIVESSGVFNNAKFAGLKNPFDDLFTNLLRIKNISGEINPGLITKVYEILDQLGISIFVATSED